MDSANADKHNTVDFALEQIPLPVARAEVKLQGSHLGKKTSKPFRVKQASDVQIGPFFPENVHSGYVFSWSSRRLEDDKRKSWFPHPKSYIKSD
ncbi:hypothetical protein X801_04654 [Opisthorchis viverrini]|uniref:Uncharacterized protein n=1 Tax=Opisthorchis viverrini TaxID=6198 RepID=A0A1S8WYJ6_OPIVI|nr:hypothetical protein X801_04654 [Opisthorchis viverrini]